MMKVLITGVAGFLGRYLAREFDRRGCQVLGLDMIPPENAPTNHLKGYYQIALPSGRLEELLAQERPQVCLHAVGRASVGHSLTSPAEDFAATVPVTFQLLEALRSRHPAGRLIFLSSAAVYGNPQSLPVSEDHPPGPISPYGYHKLLAELLCREYAQIYGLPVVIARIFSAYGPGLRRQVLWDLCYKIATQPVLKVKGTGEETRDFLHARDIAGAIFVLAHSEPPPGEIFNIASGRQISIRDLALTILHQWGKNLPVEFDQHNPEGYPKKWQADVTKLEGLGFVPNIPLDQGIGNYIQWFVSETNAV